MPAEDVLFLSPRRKPLYSDAIHLFSRWMDCSPMLDGLSLDQLRAFIAAADEGSFSAAGRRLKRAQSAVSELIGALEWRVGVKLFDRAARYPVLTAAGQALLTDAREVVGGVDRLRSRAREMAAGLEPELSVSVDVLFPVAAIVEASHEFRERFPHTPLRLFVEVLGGAYQPLLDRRASLGVVGGLPTVPAGLTTERLFGIAMVTVAAPRHPLVAYAASHPGPLPRAEVARHVQLVLTDRSTLSVGREFNVFATTTWRLADLSSKHAFLLGGLGWGGMPLHAVADDLAAGRLVRLVLEDQPAGELILPMFAAYPADAPSRPGRALAAGTPAPVPDHHHHPVPEAIAGDRWKRGLIAAISQGSVKTRPAPGDGRSLMPTWKKIMSPTLRALCRPLLAVACLSASLVSGHAAAAVLKCTGPDGKLTYTDEGCPASTSKRQEVKTSPRPGKWNPTDANRYQASAAGQGSIPGPNNGGGNGSGPAPTIAGNPPALNPANSAGKPTPGAGAPSDPGQTSVGAGTTAPTDIAAPVPVTSAP